MLTRKLGRTGYEISEIGFGAWGLGGTMWRGVADSEGRKALHVALDQGVTFVDTALAYGDGHSEKAVASVMAERSGDEGIVVATKIPPLDNHWPGRAEAGLNETFPPHHIVECVERSLRNLDTDAIQLEQLHVWHDEWLEGPYWPETLAAMRKLKKEGKVLHWGVSVNDHHPETALRLLKDPLIESVQAIYNIYDRSAELELFDVVRELRLGVIVRVPFDEGALTGKVTAETVFPEGDWRHRYFRGERKAQAGERAARLGEMLGEEAVDLPELALRFCLSREEVSTVIPGMRHVEHVRPNTCVSDGRKLTAETLGQLRGHAWEKNWYGS